MKKSSRKTNKSSLKKMKEEINYYLNISEYDKALDVSLKFIEINPNMFFGYLCYIKASTHNYNKYLSAKELKQVKDIYNYAYEIANKTQKLELKKNFEDYLYDIKEVDNLKKIKTEIISKEFLKNLYSNYSTFINQNLNTVNNYAKDGKRIKNGYDFIKGLFLFFCLIFNLTNINCLLILTIPFGIFGIINIYSFVEMNFFSKGKYKLEKKSFKNMINNASLKVYQLRQEIKKTEETLGFLNIQKNSSISKLPELFKSDISNLIDNNEKIIADKISDSLSSNDIVKFTLLLEANTNLEASFIVNKISAELKDENNELIEYINDKVLEKKNSQASILLMKNIKPFNYFILGLTLFISISSIVVIYNNFCELNFIAFLVAVIIGILSMITYNIDTGKHNSLSDTFSDNLLNTIFNATLIYNLIYSKQIGSISAVYVFLQIPIVLLLVLIGFVKLISIFKYLNLLNKLRK